jgi:hypothetical protein
MRKQLQLIPTFWMTWLATCFIFTSIANNRRLNSRFFLVNFVVWKVQFFPYFKQFFWKFKVKNENFQNILIFFCLLNEKIRQKKKRWLCCALSLSILAMSKVKYGERTTSSSFIPHATLLVQRIFQTVLRKNFHKREFLSIPKRKAINCNHVWNWWNLVSSIIIEQMNTSN